MKRVKLVTKSVAVLLAALVFWGCRKGSDPQLSSSGEGAQSVQDRGAKPATTVETMPAVGPSRGDCESYFKNRPVRDPSPRIATWNLRWFPDGTPDATTTSGTDIEWLACVLASLEVDVVAVQEVKTTAPALAAMDRLLSSLKALSGATFRVELDRCELEDDAHVGFIYNTERVSADQWQDYPTLNPYGVSCQGRLRTGFGGYFKFVQGPDMSLVSVHLKSGPDQRSYTLRRRSLAGMGSVFPQAYALDNDADVLVLGDFNTMGCSDCVPAISSAAELEVLAEELSRLSPRFKRLPTDLACSQYYGGRAGLLDHIVASEPLLEFPPGAVATVAGYCGEARCSSFATPPAGYTSLSDHCPLVLELHPEDRD